MPPGRVGEGKHALSTAAAMQKYPQVMGDAEWNKYPGSPGRKFLHVYTKITAVHTKNSAVYTKNTAVYFKITAVFVWISAV